MWWLLFLPLSVYLAICVLLFFGQNALIFPTGQVGAAGPPPPGSGRLELATASGARLRGLHIPPARPSGERLLILGFGGNAWNGEVMAAFLHRLYPQADIVAFHYRGYRPSEGSPSATALREDALQIHDFARARLRPRRIVAVGFSVGSGVAAALAAARPIDGAILVTPFDSLERVAAGHYPWLPVRALFRNRLDPAGDLAATNMRVAIVAGGRDTLIPPARTDALRRSVPNLAFDRTIPAAGHNDLYDHPDFAGVMAQALDAVRR
ncbi:alpha/beta fold hydrolase [Sphingosinicella sp. LHD-64]|uniref:alpha/beta hydrolase n=1 Tax=Sphingosinicella sp. LHD-64 TaxID=3072139 RepID=UPI00280CCE45|nr:alpha/beta fold hydrolase [Sphingosinicella sp. LHD-64]MDQ8754852.1 alpha/beta fold hydrolase [Sphingosinicella sp. LHD-64]